LLVCLVQVITAITAIFFGARTGMGVGRDLRRAIYRQVDDLSMLEVGKFGSATLITRNTNDVQQVQMLVLMTLNFMVSTPIMCITPTSTQSSACSTPASASSVRSCANPSNLTATPTQTGT